MLSCMISCASERVACSGMIFYFKLTHPIHPRFGIPFYGALLQPGPKFNRAFPRDIAYAEFTLVPTPEGKGFAWHGHAHVDADHTRAGPVHHISRITAVLGE